MNDVFYVYEHWRPDIDVCFYVGKGTGKRAFLKKNRNEHHARVVKKLARAGMCFEIRMYASGLSEARALELERDRIAFWRGIGISLVNQTAGGDGMLSPSDEVRQKMSDAHKLRWSDDARAEAARKTREHMQDPEARARISRKLAGTTHTHGPKAGATMRGSARPQMSARMSGANNPFFGKKHSAEVLARIVAKNTGRKLTDAHKRNIGQKIKGLKRSDETRAKQRAAWVRRRERMAVP